MKPTVAFAALALLAGCARDSHEQATPDSPLRLVTWNVRKCESGIDRIVEQLRRLDADVICLQELTEPRASHGGPDQARQIAAALGMHVYSHGAPLDDRRNQCVAILSRTPLSDARPLRVGDARRNYGVTAVVERRDGPLRVVSVHLAGTYMLDWRHIRRTWRERGEEWNDLLGHAAVWDRTVIAGDFNTGAEPARLRVGRTGWAVVAPKGPTWPSGHPALFLDFAICSPAIGTPRADQIDTDVSDHLPVCFDFD
jgi:endonuclease/exonuclease/phosphatase family metal-dependent hydrolase